MGTNMPDDAMSYGVQVVERPWGKSLQVDGQEAGRIVKKRREFVADVEFSLEPGSMLGSWFLVILRDKVIWQGVVVAEPAAGCYLCDIDLLEPGVPKVQRLFSLDVLMGLHTYQNQEDDVEATRPLDQATGDYGAPVIRPGMEFRFYDSEMRAMEAFQAHTVMLAKRAREDAEA